MTDKTKPTTLYGALARAQSKMPNAIFNRVNPHFRNKYADLASLRAASLPALTENGLCILQFTEFRFVDGTPVGVGALFGLVTRLAHENGEYVDGFYPLPNCPDKPQVLGSALTYGRRYGWGSMIGEASDEDDDANAAQANGKNGQTSTATISQEQADALDADIEKLGIDYTKFLTFMEVSAIADILVRDLPKAEAAIATKRKAAK
jgi:hypothetical protein